MYIIKAVFDKRSRVTILIPYKFVRFPASRDLFSVVFPELTGPRKRDLCPGSKRTLIQPSSIVMDDAYKTHAPCIVC